MDIFWNYTIIQHAAAWHLTSFRSWVSQLSLVLTTLVGCSLAVMELVHHNPWSSLCDHSSSKHQICLFQPADNGNKTSYMSWRYGLEELLCGVKIIIIININININITRILLWNHCPPLETPQQKSPPCVN